ncbi:MAG: phosphotransferase [Cognatishimia sp.]
MRQQVGQIAPWTEDAHWQTLFGGRTNAAWQVSGADDSAVLKLYRRGGQNPLFPNDPAAEAKMLRHLQGTEIAPRLIANFTTDEMDCNLYETLPGQAWTDGVERVAELIQRLHKISAPTGLRVAVNGSEELLDHALKIHKAAGMRTTPPEKMYQISVAKTASIGLLHGDIVPGNLIAEGDDLRLIDWQCPAIGDPTEDLAIFLSPAMQLLYRGGVLSDEETQSFLSGFSAEQQERYRALAPLYHFRMAAYCRWQIARGQLDYAEALTEEEQALEAL